VTFNGRGGGRAQEEQERIPGTRSWASASPNGTTPSGTTSTPPPNAAAQSAHGRVVKQQPQAAGQIAAATAEVSGTGDLLQTRVSRDANTGVEPR